MYVITRKQFRYPLGHCYGISERDHGIENFCLCTPVAAQNDEYLVNFCITGDIY